MTAKVGWSPSRRSKPSRRQSPPTRRRASLRDGYPAHLQEAEARRAAAALCGVTSLAVEGFWSVSSLPHCPRGGSDRRCAPSAVRRRGAGDGGRVLRLSCPFCKQHRRRSSRVLSGIPGSPARLVSGLPGRRAASSGSPGGRGGAVRPRPGEVLGLSRRAFHQSPPRYPRRPPAVRGAKRASMSRRSSAASRPALTGRPCSVMWTRAPGSESPARPLSSSTGGRSRELNPSRRSRESSRRNSPGPGSVPPCH